MPTRRQFLTKAGLTIGASAAGTVLYTFLVEPHWLEIVHRDLPIEGLPSDLEGRTLVQMSDLHIGPRVDNDYVIATFRRVADLAPDLVAVTGDWICYRGPAEIEQLKRVLEHLPRGRLATIGILGNHDYGHAWKMHEVAEQVARTASGAGVTMLRDDVAMVAGLHIIGLEDYWGPNFGPLTLMRRVGGERPSLVLCHNPDVADELVWGSYQGWILSGHTHGGQCKPPFLPPPQLPVRNRRYTAGEFELSGGRSIYINRGVGHLLQVRFNYGQR